MFVVLRFFEEYPHPNEKQRQQFSEKLHLAPHQIQFWFQNRRARTKVCNAHGNLTKCLNLWRFSFFLFHFTDLVTLWNGQARHDNATLKWENEKIEIENRRMKEALKNCTGTSCYNCRGAVELRLEKARLENEVRFVSTAANRKTHSLCKLVVSKMKLVPLIGKIIICVNFKAETQNNINCVSFCGLCSWRDLLENCAGSTNPPHQDLPSQP